MSAYILAVANQKGGVGKTTSSINLAASLSARHNRILLIDLDPQANATSGLGLEKTDGISIYQPLLGDRSVDEFIRPTAYERLDIVPSELDLAGAEIDIARSDNYLHRLKEATAELALSDRYDHIIIDCPPSLGILTMNGLTAADGVMIPIQCEYYALEGLSVMISLIERLRNSGANPTLEIEGILMTMYDMRTNLSRQVVEEVRNHFNNLIYDTVIPRTVRLSEAPSFGAPIIAYDSSSIASVAYLDLAQEFMSRRNDKKAAP